MAPSPFMFFLLVSAPVSLAFLRGHRHMMRRGICELGVMSAGKASLLETP
jgi:hypothetical protein